MICADFLAGANLDGGDPNTLLHSMSRFFQFLPSEQRNAFAQQWSIRFHREPRPSQTTAITA
jgi:hypothetical protein